MAKREDSKWKGAIWGVFLILLGVSILLDRQGLIDMPHIWGLWPILFFAFAVSHLADGRFGSAVMMVGLGIWFFANNEGWWGFDWMTTWPLLIVVVGLSIVIKAVTREDEHRRHRKRAADTGSTAVEVPNDQ